MRVVHTVQRGKFKELLSIVVFFSIFYLPVCCKRVWVVVNKSIKVDCVKAEEYMRTR